MTADMHDKTTEELIDELEGYSEEGSLEATVFLEDLHRKGVLGPLDEDDADWLSSLRCLQGDFDECWRRYLRGDGVMGSSIKDHLDMHGYDYVSHRKVSCGRYLVEYEPCDRRLWSELPEGMHAVQSVNIDDDPPLCLMLRIDRDRAGRMLRELAEAGDPRAAYDLRSSGFDCEGLEDVIARDPRAIRDLLAQVPVTGEHFDSLRHVFPEMGFSRARDIYFGDFGERDLGRALALAVEAAEDGCGEAADLVSLMVDHHPPTDFIRCRGWTDEEIEAAVRRAEENRNVYGAMKLRQRPYRAPCRTSLQDGFEWEAICLLTRTEAYGETCDHDHENDSGGYEDGVICMRPFDWGYEEEPERAARPNLLFKPSGFNMEWYKYPWRGAEMSENLSIGEIRRIWRLCIDHLITGRMFGTGTTEEFLRTEPARVDVPDALSERVGRVLEIADANENIRVRFLGSMFCSSYVPRKGHEAHDGDVRDIIEELRGRLSIR